MAASTWIILSLAVACVHAQDGIYSSNNFPSFYKDEEGVFKCSFTMKQEEFTTMTGFGVRMVEPTESSDVLGCSVSRSPGLVTVNTAAAGGPSKEDCEKAVRDLEASLSTEIIIKMKLEDAGKYMCVWHTSLMFFNVGEGLNVDQLLVAPTKLEMEVKPAQEMYSGDKLEVVCTSEGGDPAADLVYEKNEEELDAAPSYVVSEDDNGSMFKCRDKSHPNYNGGESGVTSQEKEIVVYYLKGTKPENIDMAVNPSRTESLDCTTEQNLPDGTNITYTWKQNNQLMASRDRMIEVSGDQYNQTVSETYECEAKTDDIKLGAVKVVYNITWDVKTSTPTQPPQATKEPEVTKPKTGEVKPGNSTTTIIIVVVVVTVVILIVIVIIIVVKKKNSRSAEVSKGSKGAQQPTQAKGDPEQGNGEADATEPMLGQERTTSGGKGQAIDQPREQ